MKKIYLIGIIIIIALTNISCQNDSQNAIVQEQQKRSMN
jgi:hypothetical protein